MGDADRDGRLACRGRHRDLDLGRPASRAARAGSGRPWTGDVRVAVARHRSPTAPTASESSVAPCIDRHASGVRSNAPAAAQDQRLCSFSRSLSTLRMAAARSPPALRSASPTSRSLAPGSKIAVRRCLSSEARCPIGRTTDGTFPDDDRRRAGDLALGNCRSMAAVSRSFPEAGRARDLRPKTQPPSASPHPASPRSM